MMETGFRSYEFQLPECPRGSGSLLGRQVRVLRRSFGCGQWRHPDARPQGGQCQCPLLVQCSDSVRRRFSWSPNVRNYRLVTNVRNYRLVTEVISADFPGWVSSTCGDSSTFGVFVDRGSQIEDYALPLATRADTPVLIP